MRAKFVLSAACCAALVLLPRPVSADCDSSKITINGNTTVDMEADAGAQFQKADAKLNATYKKLQAEIDPQGKKLLVKAERAWVAYRDSECAFDADQYRGGTLELVEHPTCMLRLTLEHEGELEQMVSDYGPH